MVFLMTLITGSLIMQLRTGKLSGDKPDLRIGLLNFRENVPPISSKFEEYFLSIPTVAENHCKKSFPIIPFERGWALFLHEIPFNDEILQVMLTEGLDVTAKIKRISFETAEGISFLLSEKEISAELELKESIL